MTGEDSHSSGSADINRLLKGDYMNLDDSNDYREMNIKITNYVMAEFVAIPPTFNLRNHLTMREHIGMFEVKNMNIKQAEIFVDSIKSSAVFSSMNNAIINPSICFFVLQLFQDLGLVLNSIDNPMRRNQSNEIYKWWSNHWEQDRTTYVRGQEIMRISFLIVNVVHLLNDEVYGEALKVIENIEKLQSEIENVNVNLDIIK
jgi:hypothetical protein